MSLRLEWDWSLCRTKLIISWLIIASQTPSEPGKNKEYFFLVSVQRRNLTLCFQICPKIRLLLCPNSKSGNYAKVGKKIFHFISNFKDNFRLFSRKFITSTKKLLLSVQLPNELFPSLRLYNTEFL